MKPAMWLSDRPITPAQEAEIKQHGFTVVVATELGNMTVNRHSDLGHLMDKMLEFVKANKIERIYGDFSVGLQSWFTNFNDRDNVIQCYASWNHKLAHGGEVFFTFMKVGAFPKVW
jgi:ssDNA-specific exonuclease RecJ